VVFEPIARDYVVVNATVWRARCRHRSTQALGMRLYSNDHGAVKWCSQCLSNRPISASGINDRARLPKVRDEQLDAPCGRSVEIEWIAVYSFRE
jgi:hypothetical protein